MVPLHTLFVYSLAKAHRHERDVSNERERERDDDTKTRRRRFASITLPLSASPSPSAHFSRRVIVKIILREKKKFRWTTCQQNGTTTTDVSIVSAELSPDPVRPGGAATFVLRGVVTSDDGVPDSAVIDVDIRYQSVPVYRDVLKLCETVRKNDDDENGETTLTGCPIRKKKNNGTTTRAIMEYDAKVPELAPSGEFDARFLAKEGAMMMMMMMMMMMSATCFASSDAPSERTVSSKRIGRERKRRKR